MQLHICKTANFNSNLNCQFPVDKLDQRKKYVISEKFQEYFFLRHANFVKITEIFN